MKRISELQPGDRITIFNNYEPVGVRTVARVTKTSITDDSGGRWNTRGSPWGSGEYCTSCCTPHLPEHDAKIVEVLKSRAEKKRREHLKYLNWSDVPQSVVDQCFDLVKAGAK
ncbi:MAG: hypothetical protein IT435_02615 [Phycisphaerales bacterium]|nr:hypothetical protein [Phycisphaerales bacterium]